MIGNDKQLEKNGWLISSIQTSSSGLQDWKKESIEELGIEQDRENYLLILRSMAYLAPEISRLKQQGVIGEALSGKLQKNPLYQPEQTESDVVEPGRLKKLLQQINEYRQKIYQKRLAVEKQKKTIPALEFADWQRNLRLVYYQEVKSGEFYEQEKGIWIRKE